MTSWRFHQAWEEEISTGSDEMKVGGCRRQNQKTRIFAMA